MIRTHDLETSNVCFVLICLGPVQLQRRTKMEKMATQKNPCLLPKRFRAQSSCFSLNFALICFFDIEMTKIWLFSFEQSRLREMVGYDDLTEEQTSEFPSLKIADSTKFSQGLIPAVPKVNQLDAKTMCARFCLVPVRLPSRPSRPIRFVDVSGTNGLFAWTT